jgi:predicted amidohydrolase
MKALVALFLCLVSVVAHAEWQPFSPREEIAPLCDIKANAGRSGSNALHISSGGNEAAFGGWRREFDNIKGGENYRFTATFQTKNVEHPRRSVIARLEWQDEKGKAVRPPDYAIDAGSENGWTTMQLVTPAPEKAKKVSVELALGFTKGSVTWDGVQLAPESSSQQRTVRALTVYCRPRNTKAPVDEFCALVESAKDEKPDLVCLPEGITVVGTGKTYADVGESVPGPTCTKLGTLARKVNSWIVAGIYERDAKVVYNTAVLIDRKGAIAGKYRKTHLPREEWEQGITPGNDYPVFDTEFGKVGLTICWDLQFPEPCRAMALKGAEIILLPIWGGSETLAKARAIENHIFLITSSYDMKSFIVDPTGAVMAEATREKPVALATLNLDQKYFQPWLGDMKNRTWKERRPDISLEAR